MRSRCDLHTHSSRSDGKDAPRTVAKRAWEAGLGAAALCDHNTIRGIPEFMRAAEKYGIEGIGGVEITTEYKKKELHILGLFIDKESFDPLNEFLDIIRRRKEEANLLLFKKLNDAGYKISYEGIAPKEDASTVNRMHFANELMRCGYISSVKEGFEGLLSEKNGYYVSAERMDAMKTIAFLRSLNIVPVAAHILSDLDMNEAECFLTEAKSNGLIAMETEHSSYTLEMRELAIALSERIGLYKSGGSDYHGRNKPNVPIGKVCGGLDIPYEYYLKLKSVKDEMK